MAETQSNQNAGAGKAAEKAMTVAEAARSVKRKIVERKPVIKGGEQARDKDGALVFEEVTREVAIAANEVLSFKDYGTHVVVVTKDGKKFSSAE
jgi:hypothetical protein